MPTTSDSFMSGGHRPGWGAVVKFIVPLAVSVGLCWIMFHNIDFNEMMKVIRHDCDFRWIGLMLAMSVAPMLLRALRWNIQLRTIGVNAPVHALVYSIIGCYSLNLVFPRLGEVWRTGYIAYREDTRFSTVFGSMIADRFADFVTVCIITAGTFFLARGPIVSFVHTYPDVYRKIIHTVSSPWIWASLIAITAAVWILFARSKSTVVAKIKGFMHGLWGGFATIGKMKEKWTWLGLTFAIWGCYYLQMVVAFNAFPLLRETLDASGAIVTLVCFVLTSIAMGVPSNGGIGPYQTTLLFGLNIFLPVLQQARAASGMAPVSAEQFHLTGAAFGNLLIASQTALQIVLGLIVFILVTLDKKRDMRPNSPANLR